MNEENTHEFIKCWKNQNRGKMELYATNTDQVFVKIKPGLSHVLGLVVSMIGGKIHTSP